MINMNLYLFDLDGTVLKHSRKEPHAYAQAFQDVYGIPVKPEDLRGIETIKSSRGLTSHQIYGAICRHFGIDEKHMEEGRKRYIKCFVDVFTAEDMDTAVLPGVPELARELYGRKHMIGLLTGNFEHAAKARIKAGGLSGYFKEGLGAFGSDPHKKRSDLGKLALRRALDMGFSPSLGAAWSLGDTAEDIVCAKESGLKIAAVATGKVGIEELKKYNPDVVLPDLTDTQAVLNLIDSHY
jgi:phosphoglycolate phosphatase